MTSPSVTRGPRVGTPRPDPHTVRWSALDLARRRSLAVARQELDDAERRGDPVAVIGTWRAVIEAMEREEASA